MTHRCVHRAAAIVAVTPRQRTRLVELRQDVGGGGRAELVPLVGARPCRRQAAGRGGAAVHDVDGALRHARVVALEAGADEPLVPRPAAARVGRRVYAEIAAAAADEALEGGALGAAADRRAGRLQEDHDVIPPQIPVGEPTGVLCRIHVKGMAAAEPSNRIYALGDRVVPEARRLGEDQCPEPLWSALCGGSVRATAAPRQ